MNQIVFVYGTLRKNEKNAHLLDGARQIAQQAWIQGALLNTDRGYPALAEGNDRVYGELYDVDEEMLEKIDRLEGSAGPGVNNMYNRCINQVYTYQIQKQAYVYVTAEKEATTWQPIPSGDWKVHLYEKEPELLYFAYGSCMDHDRLRQAGVDHLFQDVAGRGVLPGYSLRFTIKHADGGRADIVEDGGKVEGKVYRINQQAREYLYGREGVHSGKYRPIFVELELNGQKAGHVLTFMVIDKEPEETAPPDHYATEILRGGEGTLSDTYLANLRRKLGSI